MRRANNAKITGSSPVWSTFSEMVQWLGFLAFTEKAGVRFPVSENIFFSRNYLVKLDSLQWNDLPALMRQVKKNQKVH